MQMMMVLKKSERKKKKDKGRAYDIVNVSRVMYYACVASCFVKTNPHAISPLFQTSLLLLFFLFSFLPFAFVGFKLLRNFVILGKTRIITNKNRTIRNEIINSRRIRNFNKMKFV